MTVLFLPDIWKAPQFLSLLQAGGAAWQSATIRDHATHAPSGEMPVLIADPGATSTGGVITLADAILDKLTALHAVFGAVLAGVTIEQADGPQAAYAFCAPVPRSAVPPGPSMMTQSQTLALACAEIMALADSHPVIALQARWPMSLAHAASILRSADEPAPSALRRDWGRDDIALITPRQPYAWFFGVREDDLQFRRFDGDMSETVKRAGFVMSDAVTVLPYDPKRDRVMLVEQFRYGPWLRGARNAWSLEAIAGRIDPFETPQAAALREAREETGLALDDSKLLPVGNVYPSPGAITEFLYQYVALCDLPDGSEGVSGLEGEAEDIRSHVISFARLMELVGSGEVQNGPLVLTTWWLAAHRTALRGQ